MSEANVNNVGKQCHYEIYRSTAIGSMTYCMFIEMWFSCGIRNSSCCKVMQFSLIFSYDLFRFIGNCPALDYIILRVHLVLNIFMAISNKYQQANLQTISGPRRSHATQIVISSGWPKHSVGSPAGMYGTAISDFDNLVGTIHALNI